MNALIYTPDDLFEIDISDDFLEINISKKKLKGILIFQDLQV